MSKITENKIVGQPIFKQIMNLADMVDVNELRRSTKKSFNNKPIPPGLN